MAAAPTALGRVLFGLGLRQEEQRPMALLLMVFALGEAGRSLGMNASDALFFVRFGVDRLPWMYIGLGGLTFLAVMGYAAGLARYRWSFLHPLYLAVASILVAERFLIPVSGAAIYPILWLSTQVFAWVLVTAGWSLASETFDTRQAKRLFSLLASASILGSMLGHVLTAPLALTLGTENLFLVYAALLFAAFLAVRQQTQSLPGQPALRLPGRSPLSGVLAGWRELRRSRLLQLVVASSVLFSILYFATWFPFNERVSAAFSDEASLAGFLGRFTSIVMLSTLLLSLVSGRLFARFGVVNIVLVVPLIYLAGFSLWALEFSLMTAIIVRFAQLVWINGAGWTAWNALFNVFHSDRRGQLRAFESGVPSQLGTSLSGVLLLAQGRMTTQSLYLIGGATAVICGLLCWRMKAAYGQSLLDAIRAGIVDVFTGSTAAFGQQEADAQSRAVLVDSLEHEEASMRRLAAELLARVGVGDPEPLLRLVDDEAEEVRRAGAEALTAIDDRRAVPALRQLLHDPSARVRRCAVVGLAGLDVGDQRWLDQALSDESALVRAQAAARYWLRGEHDMAGRVLVEMVGSADPDEVGAALEAVVEQGIELPAATLLNVVGSSSAHMRELALRAMGRSERPQVQQAILRALGDDDERVRAAAAAAAIEIGVEGDLLYQRIDGATFPVQLAGLRALPSQTAADRQQLIDWTSQQVQQMEKLRRSAAALAMAGEGDGRGLRSFLLDLVERRSQRQSKLILSALGKLAPAETIRLVERGLSAETREQRMRALEALETLGEARVVKGFVALLESGPEPGQIPSLDTALGDLSQDKDPWVRAIALRWRRERLQVQLGELQEMIDDDPEQPVSELAVLGLDSKGGRMSQTLDTLSTMEKILHLRQVPIFNDLDPDDLHRIAEIAGERVIGEGAYLCREGDLEDELYLIVDGKVRITKLDNGQPKEIRRLGSGQPVGELAILAQQARSASVQAVDGSVRVLVIEGRAFQAILRDRPEVSRAMLSNLARRLSTMA